VTVQISKSAPDLREKSIEALSLTSEKGRYSGSDSIRAEQSDRLSQILPYTEDVCYVDPSICIPLTMNQFTVEDIRKLTPELHSFMLQAYRKLFGHLDDDADGPSDLKNFNGTYMAPGARFIVLRVAGEIVGMVGYRPFDRRFTIDDNVRSELKFQDQNVVEILRLFVKETHRSKGLASMLIAELVDRAKEDAVDIMYLHTHTFLTGARNLWEKNGWTLIVADKEPPWNTIHMSRDVRLQYGYREKVNLA
jgi:GNAT superfamily N-acetyltransferase